MIDMRTKNIVGLLLIILVIGCGRTSPNSALVRLEGMADVNPKEALSTLNSISKDELSNADKVYYDFLSVKLRDKAIIPHIISQRIVMLKHCIMAVAYIMT